MHRLFILTACLLLPVLSLKAEEKTSKHRLIGLSAAERIEDFNETMKSLPDLHVVALDAAKSEITLKYDLAKIININPKKPPTAEDIEKRLNELIGGACVRTFSLRPLTGAAEDKLTKVEIKAGVLDCKACRYAVYLAVATLDGVERATVNEKTSLLTVFTDAAKTDRKALEAALKKARISFEGDGAE